MTAERTSGRRRCLTIEEVIQMTPLNGKGFARNASGLGPEPRVSKPGDGRESFVRIGPSHEGWSF